MILYNRFLTEPIGNAPTAHLLFKQPTYLGTPHLLIGPSIMFTKTPEKDILNIEDLTEAYETLAEELLKNKPHPRKHPVANIETWYYPIPEEKYRTNLFSKIKEIDSENLAKSPVEKPPTMEIYEYELPENIRIAPHSTIISETVDGITTLAEITTTKNKLTATLIPPDLGMSTPLYFSQTLKKHRNTIIRELIEKYLDGLEVPPNPRIKTTNEPWEGKRAMLKTTYVKIIKVLIHKHRDVYSHGCDKIVIHFYSE